MRFYAVGFLVLSWSIWAVAGEEPASRFEKVTRRMVEAFNAEDYVRMRQDYFKGMADVFPQEKSTPIFAGLRAQFGKVVKLESPRLTPPNQAVFPAQFDKVLLRRDGKTESKANYSPVKGDIVGPQ
jgi:hypothetical protein